MINIDWQPIPPQNIKPETPDSQAEEQDEMAYFPRITHSRRISTSELLKLASRRTPFDRATLGAALGHLVDAVVEQIQQGNTVSVGELGTFGLQIASDRPLRRSELLQPGSSGLVHVKSIRYVPSSDILSLVGSPQFAWQPTLPLTTSAARPSDEQVLSTLSTWFESHDAIKCKDISTLFCLKPTASNTLVNHLVSMGILVKNGSGKNTQYLLNVRNTE